ncbi:hypothetical protein DVH26_18340 [Paenibacillus sp. H1-7]|uniref:CBO0543 family protein n=1 Tax=Paenibacillus sp. H1-7 TaxID=2282849 RepID=UPI001EF868D8|nr:CBO0543 family protein [Paenibacillus sp. H1-7]ULL16232.1 hypothetical protein DVH26_18340 [Paenibacillus sp. H1-7]
MGTGRVGSMLFNITLGFIIPWLFGIYLYKKDRKILLLIYPISVVISMFINDVGFHLKFWDFTPHIPDDETISALPLDLGLYPILGSYMIYWIRNSSLHWLLISLITMAFTTCLEYFGVVIGKVTYGNGWNILFTSGSYLLAYLLVYFYYTRLLKYGFLSRKTSTEDTISLSAQDAS